MPGTHAGTLPASKVDIFTFIRLRLVDSLDYYWFDGITRKTGAAIPSTMPSDKDDNDYMNLSPPMTLFSCHLYRKERTRKDRRIRI